MAESIKKQIEFYFSESNFRKDKFLRSQADSHPEGYVSIAVLITFNKLKSLSTDVKEIAASVQDSEVVTVSDDGMMIKRSSDVPLEDTSKVRTLYAKGFPIDDASFTIESVRDSFKQYGEILLARLRKDPKTKKLKGSCFIEFAGPESVAKAVEGTHNADGSVSMKWKDTTLLCVMPLTEWLKNKEAKRVKRSKQESGKKRGADGKEADNGGKKTKTSGTADASTAAAEPKTVEYTKGLIIKVSNVPAGTTLYEVKDCFKAIGEVKFVEYEGGNDNAYVRVADISSSVAIVAALEKGLKITSEHTQNVSGVILSGEEELAYWTKVVEKNAEKHKSGGSKGGRGRGGRGGGRGGRGGGRGRGGR